MQKAHNKNDVCRKYRKKLKLFAPILITRKSNNRIAKQNL